MPNLNLTEISIRALKGSDQYITYYDTLLPAFGVRVGKRRKTFVVVRGKKRERTTIGHYPAMSVGDARSKAKKLLAKEPMPRNPRILFETARDEFLADNYQNSTSEWPGIVKLILNKHFRGWEGKQLSAIADEEIEAALTAIERPSAKTHAFRVARTFFNWCLKPPHRYLRHSPLTGYQGGADKKRARILTDAELAAVWNAAGGGSRSIFRLIILWGTRSTESTLLERSWLNKGVLRIPGYQNDVRITKNGRDLAIPVLPLAKSVLDTRPPGRFYFPGRRSVEMPIQRGSLAELRRALQKESGTSGWGAHDLRRTFRSNLSRLRVSKDVAERLVNHVPDVLEEIYDRYEYLKEKQQALAKYESFMLKLIGSGKT